MAPPGDRSGLTVNLARIIVWSIVAAPIWMSALEWCLSPRGRGWLLLILVTLLGASCNFIARHTDDDRYLWSGPILLVCAIWLLISYGIGRWMLFYLPRAPLAESAAVGRKTRWAWGAFSFVCTMFIIGPLSLLFPAWSTNRDLIFEALFVTIWWGIWSIQVAGPVSDCSTPPAS
jgi:hypothetical protein